MPANLPPATESKMEDQDNQVQQSQANSVSDQVSGEKALSAVQILATEVDSLKASTAEALAQLEALKAAVEADRKAMQTPATVSAAKFSQTNPKAARSLAAVGAHLRKIFPQISPNIMTKPTDFD